MGGPCSEQAEHTTGKKRGGGLNSYASNIEYY